jgi:uncharacterized membrane protein
MPDKPEQSTSEVSARAIRENIEAIAKLEEEFNLRRSAAERFADAIGNFFGTMRFIVLQTAVTVIWIIWNLGFIPGLPIFDKFPFLLLSMAMSTEAILLTAFVLIKQDRMSRRADQRAHLDLQINLLSEREMTLVLQMLDRISVRLGVRLPGSAVEELCEETSIAVLANELEEKLSTD